MKTTAPKLPSTRRSVGPGRSRFAQYDPLMLELFKKYPSRSGRNINFVKAFEDDPSLHDQLNGEEITALRSRASDVIEKHLAAGNGGQASTRTTHNRKASRFAVHDELLQELFKKFPSDQGKCISFKRAFEAEPSLRQKLGIKTEQDMHSCEQHARLLFRGPKAKVKRKKAARQLAVIPEAPAPTAAVAAESPAPLVNFCWNCGEPQPSKALALMHRMARR